MASALYQAGPVSMRRARRTAAQVAQLEAQLIEALRTDHPQSVRHLYYLMTNPRLAEPVEKTDKGYSHVQERLVSMRRRHVIPYAWIADMSRRGYYTDTFEGVGDFLRRSVGLYRSNLWRDAATRCEVWVESRSIASVLLDDCEELAVNLFPCGGFSSIAFAHDSAQQINASRDARPVTVLYVGDLDAAGTLIDVTLERELRMHLRPDIELRFMRLGITEAQVQEYDLPTKPRKEGEKRQKGLTYTVEAEAMPAHILRSIVREAVESLLPEDALRVAQVAEESEREHIERMAAIFDRRDRGEAIPALTELIGEATQAASPEETLAQVERTARANATEQAARRFERAGWLVMRNDSGRPVWVCSSEGVMIDLLHETSIVRLALRILGPDGGTEDDDGGPMP